MKRNLLYLPPGGRWILRSKRRKENAFVSHSFHKITEHFIRRLFSSRIRAPPFSRRKVLYAPNCYDIRADSRGRLSLQGFIKFYTKTTEALCNLNLVVFSGRRGRRPLHLKEITPYRRIFLPLTRHPERSVAILLWVESLYKQFDTSRTFFGGVAEKKRIYAGSIMRSALKLITG